MHCRFWEGDDKTASRRYAPKAPCALTRWTNDDGIAHPESKAIASPQVNDPRDVGADGAVLYTEATHGCEGWKVKA